MFSPDHATTSVTIPATICVCVGLNRKLKYSREVVSGSFSRVLTEVVLSETEFVHARSALREFADNIWGLALWMMVHSCAERAYLLLASTAGGFERGPSEPSTLWAAAAAAAASTARSTRRLRIWMLRGFGSVGFRILRGGVPRSTGAFPEICLDSKRLSLGTLSQWAGRKQYGQSTY